MIAIIPPEPIYSNIIDEQEYIAQTWGPSHGLRTPPHITLIPPLYLTSAEVGLLYGIAGALSGAMHTFQIDLKNYASFKPRVVYIHPAENEHLFTLHGWWRESLLTTMAHVLEKYPDRPYNPHLTLAHKDVTHPIFEKMWRHYANKSYQASFLAEHFSILQHEQKGWSEEKKFFFSPAT
jgi:2'-5' RNA ligase